MRENNLLVANLVLIDIRELLLDEEKGMYERYAALFALRNDGGNEAVAAIIDSLGSKSALLKHEV
jgi:deoxyhypusine monooxygenase